MTVITAIITIVAGVCVKIKRDRIAGIAIVCVVVNYSISVKIYSAAKTIHLPHAPLMIYLHATL